jgi:hypothetical protein
MRTKMLGIIAIVVATIALIAATGASPAGASPSKSDFNAGDGSLWIASRDVASASDGATITINSIGAFDVASGTATSWLGTFEHRAPDHSLLATGTFTVTGLRSFASFGCGVVGGVTIPPCGGHAEFSVHVVGHPVSGGTEAFDAVFTVTSVVGDSVPPGAKEGVTFDVPGLISFDHPVGGETLFVQK